VARPSVPVAIAIALPLLLALVVAGIAITVRARGLDGSAPPPPDTSPLAVAPVDAPQAGDGRCAMLLLDLNGDLPADGGTLPQRALADPVQSGVRAWAASPRPVVLRCGLPRPAELTPTSALLVVNGVSWLKLDDGIPDPVVVTYVAVDRPVYVALTTPTAAGSGPLQQVSDVVRTALPATPVAVR
jgi:Protein of unknown function (DUF3515)